MKNICVVAALVSMIPLTLLIALAFSAVALISMANQEDLFPITALANVDLSILGDLAVVLLRPATWLFTVADNMHLGAG